MYPQKEASVYDAFYLARKDYAAEAARLKDLILSYKRSDGNDLLDVACGTGLHLIELKLSFDCEGIDLSEDQLGIARQRHPDLTFAQADMTNFNRGRQFDVVTCLFSSIGYVKTQDRLVVAMGMMAKHLKNGGLLIVEPWIKPDEYMTGTMHADLVNQPTLKIARMCISKREDDVSIQEMHYMVGRPTGVEEFIVVHEMGLFSHEDYMAAIHAAGLSVVHDKEGLMGRGLYIGMKR